MIENEYYSLEVAARRLNCQVDQLLNLAVNERLSIYALVAHLKVTRQSFNYIDLLKEFDLNNPPKPISERHIKTFFILPVCALCLSRFEAGNNLQKLGIEVDVVKDSSGINELAHIFIVTDSSGQAPTINDVKFVILHSDLAKLEEINLKNGGLGNKFTVKEPTYIWFQIANNALKILDFISVNQNRESTSIEKPNELIKNVKSVDTDKPYWRDIDNWLYETWVELGCPGGSEFFRKLKLHKDKPGSPISGYYSAGSKIGIDWKTHYLNDFMALKTLQNKVTGFKKNLPEESCQAGNIK